ncbi:biotin--[acetyl-CoA-carboxylase] ligase [Haliovirga abyssi]|uniref:Biotin--[acetyl-CoA-carboxylase] ligase n=1 Tax=Haliovirga abyssi TaxID=2996794 RepID=A0AAU9DUP1_9FUSO|nr:biotin--[acetyl-CoA-carboxylase] ligase [Haliovirga abyssi]BDU49726.1 biotin--[acetyl-CoA-carboxylase] ligase [Haliovirga abyssi]
MDLTILEKIDSTNKYLKEKKYKKNWEIVMAKEQTAGKGRRGKVWNSNKGGAWFSFCFAEDKYLSKTEYGKIPLIAGLAVIKGLEEIEKLNYKIKWPNDVYVGKRKISGILLEKSGDFFIVGIGINVNNVDFGEFKDIGISLNKITDKIYNIEKLVMLVASKFKKEYYRFLRGEWEEILLEIKEKNYLKNRVVEVMVNSEVIKGEVIGINNSAELCIKKNNEIYEIKSGEIRIVYTNN